VLLEESPADRPAQHDHRGSPDCRCHLILRSDRLDWVAGYLSVDLKQMLGV
jgi:hypothetical protein